jgi:hypothetical protein
MRSIALRSSEPPVNPVEDTMDLGSPVRHRSLHDWQLQHSRTERMRLTPHWPLTDPDETG